MISSIRTQLFRLARSKIATFFIGFVFEYLPFLIPVKKIETTSHTLTFVHPKKYWEHHYLVVPKKKVPALMSLDFSDESAPQLLQEIYCAAIRCAHIARLHDYTILVNGNRYQDVPQLHFHVASGLDTDGRPHGRDEIDFQHTTLPFTSEIDHWQLLDRSTEKKCHITFISKSLFDWQNSANPLSSLFGEVERILQKHPLSGFAIITHIKQTNEQPNNVQISLIGEP